MKPHKAPGADGFQSFFFQKYWHVVGNTVHKFVLKAFETGVFDPKVNKAFLVLIPKNDNMESLKQFRPISLCNVLYKILTKVSVNRLKNVMDKLSNPLQASFVPGRQTTDNIFGCSRDHSQYYKEIEGKTWQFVG